MPRTGLLQTDFTRPRDRGTPAGGRPIPGYRIVLVADAFDALTSNRPYRPGRSAVDALVEIRANAGTQFCPRVVAQLEALHRDEPASLEALDESLAGAA